MAESRMEFEWDLQSTLLALIANVHRDSKKYPKGFDASFFNPMIKKTQKRVASFNQIEEDIAVFKRMSKRKRRSTSA